MRKIRKNSKPYSLFKYLLFGTGVITISLISPMSGSLIIRSLIQGYFRNKRFERLRFLRDLRNLQQRKLVRYRELNDGHVEIKITKRGKLKTLQYKLDELQLRPPKRWDRKWRLVLFDIPYYQKQARDALRQKLENMKFYRLQKSAYLIPYPCENEIDFLRSVFDIHNGVLILYIDHFEGEEKLKHYFNLD